jgi:hypothetical protein
MQSALTVGVLPQRTIGGNRLETIICLAAGGKIAVRQVARFRHLHALVARSRANAGIKGP